MKIERALVVDDSKVAHHNLRKLLTERGVEVDWVGSGEDCLDYLKKQRPDLVFMDVMMPGMDGFDTTGAINRALSTNPPPVVICSANATDEDRENAEKNGAVGFLSKPYTPENLDQILASIGGAMDIRSINGDEQDAPKSVPTPQSQTVSPQAEQPVSDVPTHEKAIADVKEMARAVAEKTARGVAEEAARRVAADLARLAAEKTIRMGVERAEIAAREVAKNIAAQIARAAAEETAQSVAEQAAQQLQLSAGPGIDSRDLNQQIEMQIAEDLKKSLAGHLASASFRKQLTRMVQDIARPLIDSNAREAADQTARQTATQLLEEVVGPRQDGRRKAAMLRANLAVAASVIAIVAAVAVPFVL